MAREPFWVVGLSASLLLAGCGGKSSHHRQASPGGTTPDAGTRTCGAFKGFAPQVTYGVAHEPTTILAVDRTREGHSDLLVGERSAAGDSSELFVNQGSGTFQASASYGAPGDNVANMAFADFDGDDKLDLASQPNSGLSVDDANATGVLGVDYGTESGTFAPSLVTTPTPRANAFFVASDFNGDGRPDLAFAGYNYVVAGGSITDAGLISLPGPEPTAFALDVFFNDGNRSFATPVAYPDGEFLQYADFRAGDFDGDGHVDLAVLSNQEPSGVGVYLNAGDGSFGEEQRYIASDGWVAYGLAIADFDGDGKDDAATTTIVDPNMPDEANVLAIFFGNGDRTLHGPVKYPITDIPSVYQVVPGDFNGDGHIDLAMVMKNTWGSATPIPIAVFENNGDGSFRTPVTYDVGGQAFQLVTAIAAGDFNADGVSDIAVTTTGSESTPDPESVTVLLSQCE